MSVDLSILDAPSDEVAPRLLGCQLIRQVGDQRIVVRIVECEAYDQTDPASHSYRGPSKRNGVMFGPRGHLYVYFTYGMHYCANIVTGPKDHGSGVLIRAVEPVEGLELIRANRPGISDRQLTNGPAKTAQALAIDFELSGHDLNQPPLQLLVQPAVPATAITAGPRIGISRAIDQPWRFYLTGNPYVSKPN